MPPDGETLRAWRRSRGWDVPEMARQLRRAAHGSGQQVAAPGGLIRMIYAWERGDHAVSERYGLLYGRVMSGAGEPGRREPQEDGVPRRDFVALAAGVISLLDVLRASPGLPARLSAAVDGRASVDAETAAGLAQVMDGYRRIYQSAGAASLLEPVCGTFSLLGELAPAAGAWRDLLVSLIGQASSLTATMLMLDGNDQAAAARYLTIAARAAQQAGDDELMAIIYAARAFHSAYGGDPLDGLAYARQAVSIASRGDVHPRTRGWVCAVESEMHATTGDETSFRRALDIAEDQLAGPMPDEPWKGIGAFSLAKLTAYRGGGLMRLGRYPDAQAHLTAALGQLDLVHAKHRCTAHVDLAAAFAADRKPDQAAHHSMAALDIIATTGHANSLRRIGRVAGMIGPSGTQASRDLASRYLEVKATS